MDEVLRPFEYEFFRNGLAVATVAGALCASIGCYVVVRGMSYIGHGLSHAVLAGYAISSVAGFGLLAGAGVWGLASAALIARVSRRGVAADAAIAVITTTSFAFGLALLQASGTPARNADAVLFGNILGVASADVWAIVAVSVGVSLVLALRYRALLFTAFDPEVASVSGVRTARMDLLLMGLLTLVVLASMSVLGVTLVAAAIVIPAAAARLVADSFTRMLPVAVAVGAGCGFGGMVASYHLDIAPGPTIVLADGACFAVAYLLRTVGARRPRGNPAPAVAG
jgi:manganese/iron transport system permease protein/iron/zinc/copper transport system permease protein